MTRATAIVIATETTPALVRVEQQPCDTDRGPPTPQVPLASRYATRIAGSNWPTDEAPTAATRNGVAATCRCTRTLEAADGGNASAVTAAPVPLPDHQASRRPHWVLAPFGSTHRPAQSGGHQATMVTMATPRLRLPYGPDI